MLAIVKATTNPKTPPLFMNIMANIIFKTPDKIPVKKGILVLCIA